MLAGLVGVFLGSLVGVACIVGIGQLGYVASISGVVMVPSGATLCWEAP